MSAFYLLRRTAVTRSVLQRSLVFSAATAATTTTASKRPKTGVVMLNMGGPSTLTEVEPFLSNLFSDPDIFPLGRFQSHIASFIARRRSPKIEAQYSQIGGGSPIRKWSELQGREMCAMLDELRPESAPHKPYVAFRYANPLTEEALTEMAADGVERAVAFSQYPQFSCTTAGSSYNQLWRELRRLGLEERFSWSLIDRFPDDDEYIKSVADTVRQGLASMPEPARKDCTIVFSSHSLPLRVVEKGDQYPQEMAASVQLVMKQLAYSHPYIHAWQSKVGFLPWISPSTEKVLQGLGERGRRHVLVVPIGFTSDHVETLFELDIEYRESAIKAGIETYCRAPSLNGSKLFIAALAGLVKRHLDTQQLCSTQYRSRCPGCVNPDCRNVLRPATTADTSASTDTDSDTSGTEPDTQSHRAVEQTRIQ